MGLSLISNRAERRSLELYQKKITVEQTKRKRTLSKELEDWFSPKHYPSIFFDQRLRSRIFK